MEISSGLGESELQSVDSFEGFQSSVNQKQCPDDTEHDNLISELENSLAETLYIEEVEETEQAKIRKMDERNECGRPKMDMEKPSQKVLIKCASFPFPNKLQISDASSTEEPGKAFKGGSEQDPHNAYTRSVSLPNPSKLVSAMKGSREKRGASPKKLTVSWAPDVYDPTPTSVSHSVKGKKQQKHKNNRKNWKKDGKKGQKGNTSRGKDKKQIRKAASGSCSSSDRCYKPLDCCGRLEEANDGYHDMAVGSPDPQSYCGSSFLKKSLTEMHYPVAEAL
ncbi:hypothetical protein FNV43_RR16843 [Rhamnella rubrinervis]|uniref:Uncharacterized protein n=1 Tax=Rhamnella rubrinervis TaxID=2594499 RepID=A0A8K0MDQ9_9ROSA|nr:hypothetical protein FNV43_RR16843 [Rhamnella rubrinervis]